MSAALRRARWLAALLALAALAPAGASDRLVVSPGEWSFGRIADSRVLQLDVSVRSESDAAVRVSFVPSCDCLSAAPAQADIAPGAQQVFQLSFDPAGYEGPVDKDFVVRTSLEGLEKSLFRVYGEVQASGQTRPPHAASPAVGQERPEVALSYYYSPGCRSCERFLAEEVPSIEEELGVTLDIRGVDIFDPAAYEAYLRLLRGLGEQERAYPAVVAGARVLQGEREIEAGLREAVLSLAEGSSARGAGAPDGRGRPLDLAVLPVIAAGLLDGVNPCAFTTLIFLISALAVAGRSRGQVLVLGLFYSASVFVTYFLIGLGFFGAVRYASSFLLVSRAIRWLLVAVLALFAALSVHDYLRIRRGETGRVLLQLPTAMKKQIHASIRARARSAALVGSAVALGFLVSVFELACTGQVYLPTIVYVVRTGAGLRGYGYLLLYNLGFIIPLLGVFALSFAGLRLTGLTAFFQRSMAGIKLALAGLFLALAVLTVLF